MGRDQPGCRPRNLPCREQCAPNDEREDHQPSPEAANGRWKTACAHVDTSVGSTPATLVPGGNARVTASIGAARPSPGQFSPLDRVRTDPGAPRGEEALAPSDLLHVRDRAVANAHPRAPSRHRGGLGRRHHDLCIMRARGIVQGDRVVGDISRDADQVAVDSFDEIDAVVASSTVASVRAWAMITPRRSTPRWSLFQPRLPHPPWLAAAHAPSPTIDSTALSCAIGR